MWFGPDDQTLLADIKVAHDRYQMVAVDRTTGRTRSVSPAVDQELVSGDGTAVAVCRESGDHVTLGVHRVRDGRRQGRTYTDHNLICHAEAIDASGHRIVLGAGGEPYLWLLDVDQAKVVSRFPATGDAAQMVSARGGPLLVTIEDTRIAYTKIPAPPAQWILPRRSSLRTAAR